MPLVLPADHVIRDVQAFTAAAEAAIEPAERGRLVAFGIVPHCAVALRAQKRDLCGGGLGWA